ncbi:acetyl-CoA carboxylase biotin carboxyl carrier protein [Bacillus kwashiorkori]|uniref:acetyl-CoA carboxylase biotin carboxyl carrier protein n=1 Tax=Bacillus kwashiorkori TaxID=1522318 RepID=UPI0007842808|nr:acetyl-CoA carboxylase biotin carboxyl carrier protein [Bacillus kwashiorkori]
MLKVQEIRELIRLVDQSSINEFDYEYDGLKLVMKKAVKNPIVNEVQQVVPQEPIVTVAQPNNVQQEVKQQVAEPAVPLEPTVKNEENLHPITSPMVGTFYQAPSPDANPYVTVGAKVAKDTIVCIVEAMKLFNEIEADVNGEIVEILVKDGQLVEYGQPLFLVKAE